MARKTKEDSLDLYNFSEENKQKQKNKQSKQSSKKRTKNKNVNVKKNDKVKEKETKEEYFNFDEEIIIGLRRIDDDKAVQSKKNHVKKKINKKQNKRQTKELREEDSREKIEIDEIQSIVQQKRREEERKKLTPKQELTRKKRKAILRLLKWTSLLCIVIGGIIYTLLSPIFNIKTVNVVGNSKFSIDEIISLSRIELERNMFQYKKQEIVNLIKENAYIDNVTIKRKIPDTIEIIVSERQASFKIAFANAYALINNQGYILEITNRKEQLPIINGIQTVQEDIQTGNRLCTEDLKKLGDVLKIMESATSNGLAKWITKIDITDSDNYILTLQEKKKTVYLGDISNLSTKMLWILKFNELEGNTQGEILLNMNLNNEKNKPIFRRKV